MSIVGRRGSSGSGWTWSRPPSGPRRPPPSPPLLPLAGAGLIVLLVGFALLAAWLSDGDDDSPAAGTATATPRPAATATPFPSATATPTPTATATPIPTPSPTATPTATPTSSGGEPRFRLAIWDERGWQFGAPPKGATYREGEAIPLLLRIDRARPGAAYPLTIRYDCKAFARLTSYSRDRGSKPALASRGPESVIADTTLSIPDDPASPADDGDAGSLSLWGGTFTGLDGPLPSSACRDKKSLTVRLTAAADTLYLLWAAEVSPGAAERDAPLRLTVRAPGVDDLTIEIDPKSVRPEEP